MRRALIWMVLACAAACGVSGAAIFSVGNGYYLTADTKSGGSVYMVKDDYSKAWFKPKDKTQDFLIATASNAQYRLMLTSNTQLCLEVEGCSNFAKLKVRSCASINTQRFTLLQEPGRVVYSFQPVCSSTSSMCLDVDSRDGTVIHQYDCWWGSNQLFTLRNAPSGLTAKIRSSGGGDGGATTGPLSDGTWSDRSDSSKNAYVATFLSCKVYEAAIDAKGFDAFQTKFCSMAKNTLGAKGCTAVYANAGTEYAVLTTDSSIFVIFRGTAGMTDIYNDVKSIKLRTTYLFGGWSGVKVGAGFSSAFEGAVGELLRHVKSLVPNKDTGKTRSVWIMGHSLGGAMATFAAQYLVYSGVTVTGVYTVGSPMAGDTSWKNIYKLGSVTYRYNDPRDGIPLVPPGLSHVGVDRTVPSCRNVQPFELSKSFTYHKCTSYMQGILDCMSQSDKAAVQKYV